MWCDPRSSPLLTKVWSSIEGFIPTFNIFLFWNYGVRFIPLLTFGRNNIWKSLACVKNIYLVGVWPHQPDPCMLPFSRVCFPLNLVYLFLLRSTGVAWSALFYCAKQHYALACTHQYLVCSGWLRSWLIKQPHWANLDVNRHNVEI